MAAIIRKLAKGLRRNRFFSDVTPIESAKVPIVKLRHRATGSLLVCLVSVEECRSFLKKKRKRKNLCSHLPIRK